MKFPLIGSAVLVGLFAVFKFLPKELINKVLTFYFMALGSLACTGTMLPFANKLFTKQTREKAYEWKQATIPYFMKVRHPSQTSVGLRPTVCTAWQGHFCAALPEARAFLAAVMDPAADVAACPTACGRSSSSDCKLQPARYPWRCLPITRFQATKLSFVLAGANRLVYDIPPAAVRSAELGILQLVPVQQALAGK